ncbi:unnamed protein product [Symbiodinium microadriaticum]|nr:unnamed protein product [Symbiodinium microadriaticum]
MATPTASVRPQSVGNGLHAQGETWAEPCEEDRGRLIEIEAPVEEKDASKLQRTLPVAKWLGITAFQMVYVCVSTGMGVIVLPQEAERFHQPNSSMWVGVYMGISGSTQLICPVVGKLSDRHRSSWGRRRPFIATGSILAVLGLLLMRAASANLLPTLFVLALLGLQLAVNGVYAAQCGLPADFLDTVESSGSDKAVVSGLVAMYTFLGSLLSMTIVILTRNMPIQIHYLIYVATILVVSMLVCYCATEASSLNITPGALSLADIRRTYLIDPSKDADFAWVCAGRMCYYVSTSVAAFMYYYFRDMMHVETESRRRMVIGLLAIVMQCVGMLAAVPLGRLSNRWGRKPVIYISCMFMSCTFLLYVLAPLNAKVCWISTYSEIADDVDQWVLKRYAAPVASWIAYCPEVRIPTVEEFRLLTKFMDKMDGGLLPSRLSDVLCEMKGRLQSLPRPADDADDDWDQAERRLQQSYRKLLRRCNETVAGAVVVATDGDAEWNTKQHEALQVREADDSGSPRTSARCDRHLTLFRKMNEWGFLDDAQKLERLEQAEEASRHSRRSLSQEDLADILNMAAACLAAPRRPARLQDAAATNEGEVRTAPDSQDSALDLQKRIRKLLLHALRLWQMNQFDCQAIEHVLDFVQQKIGKFEKKVGELDGAAAGKAWLRIKHAVDELLLQIQPQSSSHVHGAEAHAEAAHPIKRGRVERQSGIEHINWKEGANGGAWICRCNTASTSNGRKGTARLFPISKFLEEGLGEEAAVEAALQEAKAYREELVYQGKLKPSKPKPPRSMVNGVSFRTKMQKWRVRSYDAVAKKRLCFGTYNTKEEAEVKAREVCRQPGDRPEHAALPAKKRVAELSKRGTSWPAVVAAAVFYGIGSGAYLSVDYALALDCLPKGKTAAEALGLWGVIGFLGSTMGPVIGGVLLSFSQPAGGL